MVLFFLIFWRNCRWLHLAIVSVSLSYRLLPPPFSRTHTRLVRSMFQIHSKFSLIRILQKNELESIFLCHRIFFLLKFFLLLKVFSPFFSRIRLRQFLTWNYSKTIHENEIGSMVVFYNKPGRVIRCVLQAEIVVFGGFSLMLTD